MKAKLGKLKPCPFCGGVESEDEGATGVYCFAESIGTHVVQCSDCFASTRTTFERENAIAVWNRRSLVSQKED